MSLLTQQHRANRCRQHITQQVLNRMSILGSQTNSRSKLMVHLVYVLIHERRVHQAMAPVKHKIFTEHAKKNLASQQDGTRYFLRIMSMLNSTRQLRKNKHSKWHKNKCIENKDWESRFNQFVPAF